MVMCEQGRCRLLLRTAGASTTSVSAVLLVLMKVHPILTVFERNPSFPAEVRGTTSTALAHGSGLPTPCVLGE